MPLPSDEDISGIKYRQCRDERHNQENPAHDLHLSSEQAEDAPEQSNCKNTKRDGTNLKT
jgi:hypothetical protein